MTTLKISINLAFVHVVCTAVRAKRAFVARGAGFRVLGASFKLLHLLQGAVSSTPTLFWLRGAKYTLLPTTAAPIYL